MYRITRNLKQEMPYEAWFGKKPNVAGLQEFGMAIWVLLQGQKETQKMLPKGTQQTYVRYEDGPKAIKYYNPESRKILTLRKYCFLSLSEENTPPEGVVVAPNVPHVGELRGSMAIEL